MIFSVTLMNLTFGSRSSFRPNPNSRSSYSNENDTVDTLSSVSSMETMPQSVCITTAMSFQNEFTSIFSGATFNSCTFNFNIKKNNG